tara:strand:- start:685 stop:1002 length:318 start_codon:yes stop_codon:yes gene_type:complete
MNIKKNISRENIADSINAEFGFSRKECLDIVNDIIEIIINGLNQNGIVKIHNFGTFKLKRKTSRIGRNPKTKEEFLIEDRNVILFKASKNILKFINKNENNEKIS